MKDKLEKITNLTINDLLNNKIILPSSYFEKFTYYAKKTEVDIHTEEFTKEIKQLIQNDFDKLEEFLNIISKSASSLQKSTKDAQTAILNKDEKSLISISEKMIKLENKIKSLNEEIFMDRTMQTYNRKWIYSKFLDKNCNFQKDGICVLLDIVDYFYIQKEYKDLLSKNLLLFTINFINEKLKNENYQFKIARYLENKFFIFIFNENKKEVFDNILNLQQLLSNTTLKSNSGLILNTKYSFKSAAFKKDESASVLFESLLSYEKDK